MTKLYLSTILLLLALILAAPAYAQAPTSTPFPTPTMRSFSRSDLLGKIGVKSYENLNVSPGFDLGNKLADTFPEGGSWAMTFLYIASTNGALQFVFYAFIAILVTWFLLTLLNRFRNSQPMTNFRSNMDNREAHVKERFYIRSGAWYKPMMYAKDRIEDRRSFRSYRYRGRRQR